MSQPKKEVNKQATLKRVLAYVIKNYKPHLSSQVQQVY